MTDRIHNFSAGPAVLPEPVLRKAQEAIWNVAGSGIGIMEHSHRGKVFDRILDEAEANCRALAGISDDYAVLFLQGGASLQFSMVPMNLLPAGRTADYLLTGVWAQKAVKEAKVRYCSIVGSVFGPASTRSFRMITSTTPAGPRFFCAPA
jgi:phosphoserine aminotransferase